MKIVHVASELYPFVKTGGLADAIAAQAKALAGFGHDVAAIIPAYRHILNHPDFAAAEPEFEVRVELGGETMRGDVLKLRLNSRETIYAIRRDEYFDRQFLYGVGNRDYEDNAERFIFFGKAVIEVLRRGALKADVVHCHDWQAALVPVLLRAAEQRLDETLALSTVLTIHNIAFQGVFPARTFALTGLPGEFFSVEGLEYYGQVSLLKAGIVFVDRIVTVSPNYSREIRTAQFGCGLEGVVGARAADLSGILNGIDTDVWDPATDAMLPANYTAQDLSGKTTCRVQLLKDCGFDSASKAPVFGMVCRLTEQKGIDLVIAVHEFFVETPAHLVVLGRGDAHLEKALRALAEEHPQHICAVSRLDEPMSHLIEAGADFFLMPSIFEPCGLNQMYSQHYGTVPVVTRVGGLVDSVIDIADDPVKGTGVIVDPDKASVRKALARAVALFQDPARMQQVRLRAMRQDYSWKRIARTYEALYQEIV